MTMYNGRVTRIVDGSGISLVRKKSELLFTELSLTIPQTATNLIGLLKTLTPASGVFAPFFNTTTNKLVVFNVDFTCSLKINIIGNWSGGSDNRSMEISFLGTTGNRNVQSRDAAVTYDELSFFQPISVDAGGNVATNGTVVTIKSNGGNFTANTILLIAEQMVPTP
ncbi:conserved hypothetical protein [Enterobacterales bacterium 8AC]|nr:conserved hypothetical protein [Enterobacterales bacterium 8AC]